MVTRTGVVWTLLAGALGGGCGRSAASRAGAADATIEMPAPTVGDALSGTEASPDNAATDGAAAEVQAADGAPGDGTSVSPADARTGGTPGRSCSGLAPTCGPGGSGDCCASSVIPGGTFNRSNDPTAPATISDFRLDLYEITVGRFRAFVAGYPGNTPAAGSRSLDTPPPNGRGHV